MSDHDDDSEDGDLYIIPKKKCVDIRGCADLYIYLKQNPKTFVAAVTFVTSLTCVLLIGVAYTIDFHRNSCYFVAGIAGIVSNLYGFCHFRTLMSLKKEVDVYSTNNKKFAEENNLLSKEVNRFSIAKTGTPFNKYISFVHIPSFITIIMTIYHKYNRIDRHSRSNKSSNQETGGKFG